MYKLNHSGDSKLYKLCSTVQMAELQGDDCKPEMLRKKPTKADSAILSSSRSASRAPPGSSSKHGRSRREAA